MLVECVTEFLADEGQLEVYVVGVGGLQVFQQGAYGYAVGVVAVVIAVDGEVDDGQEGVGIYVLTLANFGHGLVAEAQIDTETSQTLKDVAVVSDDVDHLVVSFIGFLLFHNAVVGVGANILLCFDICKE